MGAAQVSPREGRGSKEDVLPIMNEGSDRNRQNIWGDTKNENQQPFPRRGISFKYGLILGARDAFPVRGLVNTSAAEYDQSSG